jgi:hypothetical protein
MGFEEPEKFTVFGLRRRVVCIDNMAWAVRGWTMMTGLRVGLPNLVKMRSKF